jgi:hypothetical protein
MLPRLRASPRHGGAMNILEIFIFFIFEFSHQSAAGRRSGRRRYRNGGMGVSTPIIITERIFCLRIFFRGNSARSDSIQKIQRLAKKITGYYTAPPAISDTPRNNSR